MACPILFVLISESMQASSMFYFVRMLLIGSMLIEVRGVPEMFLSPRMSLRLWTHCAELDIALAHAKTI